MEKTETFARPDVNPADHGFDGNVYTQTVISTHREYPLRGKMLESWAQIGVEAVSSLDGNAGSPQGVAEYSENKRDGKREIASAVYPLYGATVLTETLVAKILVSNSSGTVRATGIQLANGTKILGQDIILSAGGIHTPQLLKPSGIGPAAEPPSRSELFCD